MHRGRKRVSSSQPAMNSKLQRSKSTSSANNLHQPQETTPHSDDLNISVSQPLVPTPSISKSVKRTNKSTITSLFDDNQADKYCGTCNTVIQISDLEILFLECCLCKKYYHSCCLNIDESLEQFLYVVTDIGGWCCHLCRENHNQSITTKCEKGKAKFTPSESSLLQEVTSEMKKKTANSNS